MGRTIRNEVWVQLLSGPGRSDGRTDDGGDDQHGRYHKSQALLDRAVPNHRQLKDPRDDADEHSDGGQFGLFDFGSDHFLTVSNFVTDHHPTLNRPTTQQPSPSHPYSDSSLIPAQPTPSFPHHPAVTEPPAVQLGKVTLPSTQLGPRSSLVPARPTDPDHGFITQSSPTKRKQVRLQLGPDERLPGVESENGSSQVVTTKDNERGGHRRSARGGSVRAGLDGRGGRSGSMDGVQVYEAERRRRAADATRLSQGSIERCIPYVSW